MSLLQRHVLSRRVLAVARNWGQVIIQVTRALQLHVEHADRSSIDYTALYGTCRSSCTRSSPACLAAWPRRPGGAPGRGRPARATGGCQSATATHCPQAAAGAVILCFTVHRTSILDPPGMYLCVYLDSSRSDPLARCFCYRCFLPPPFSLPALRAGPQSFSR